MAIIKSDSTDLTINADGASSSLKLQIDGVEKASINSAGKFTSTSIDATVLTGLVTDDTVDESSLKSDNAPTNDYVLTAKSSATGGLTWAAAASGATSIGGLSDGITPGGDSIGLGTSALANDDGSARRNIAIGTSAMTTATTGSYSVAVGHVALTAFNASSGIGNNVAVGYAALMTNTSGTFNTACGTTALYFNVTGTKNTAFGNDALRNTTGSYNTGIGNESLSSLTTGTHNASIGIDSVTSSATSSAQMTLGSSSITNLRCNDTSISSLSDERDKTNITDLPDTAGLELINKLRPVTFNWDRREWYEDNTSDGSKVMIDWRRWKANSGLKQGFIAQEVQTAITGEKCLEDSMIVTNDNPDKLEFAPAHLLTNTIKAIQQLSETVEELKAEIAILKGV